MNLNKKLIISEELQGFVDNIYQDEFGIRYVFKFGNGYGASVIKSMFSYGGKRDLWEVACIAYDEHDQMLCYPTLMDNDVIGWLKDEQVEKLLRLIKDKKFDVYFFEVEDD